MRFLKIIKRLKIRYKMMKNHPLTKSSPLTAMYRYISFNIRQSLVKKPRLYNWIGGLKFYVEKGDAGLVSNIYYKLMDYEDSMFLIHHLKDNDLFIDIGANLGHYTMLASGICKANVIAIEPIESTVIKLKKNIELNNLSNKVKIIVSGVGDKNEVLNFTTTRIAMNSVSLYETKETIKIQVKTLNELLKNKNPVFIKIDVEGYEYKVLKGASRILSKSSLKYLIVEFNNSGKKFNLKDGDVFALILSYGFVPIEFNVDLKKIKILDSYNKHKFNTLFIRKNTLTLNA